MKNRVLILIPILFFLMLQISHAQDSSFTEVTDIDMLKAKLSLHTESTNSIESNFVQEKHLWMLNEVLISEGVFLFKKEHSVRWQYNTPIEYTIVIHNGVFTIISNNKVNEFGIDSNPLFHEINKMIVTAIRGDFIDNPDFTALFFENNDQYLARLKPTNSKVGAMLETIEIFFDKQNMEVVKVVFKEPGDDFTSIVFKDKEINSYLSDDRFLIEKK